MLAHGFSFQPSLNGKWALRDVERRNLAFRSVVRKYHQQHPGAAHRIPEELVKVIGCAAGIDFSWHLNGQVHILHNADHAPFCARALRLGIMLRSTESKC